MSEITAPSPKQIDVKRKPLQTQPQKTQPEATRKSPRTRQSTLANVLGNLVLIDSVEPKQFSIKMPGKNIQKQNHSSSLLSFIHESGFKEHFSKIFA